MADIYFLLLDLHVNPCDNINFYTRSFYRK
jgi:hypothetical protein